MILKKLVLNNYKTYYGHQEVNLYIPKSVRDEKNKNIILIGGLNGSGKTTILKAVHYALFGKRAMREEEYRRIFSNVINNLFFEEGGRECYITLVVENDNLEEWDLRVKWIFDHNKKVVNETRDITIRKPGANIGKNSIVNSIDTFNRFIDRRIPYHVAPFFIFDGEEIKDTILRQNSTEMKQAIQKLSGLETYRVLLEDLNESKIYLERKIHSSTNNSQNINLTQEKERIHSELETTNLKLKSIGLRKQELESKIEKLKQLRLSKNQQNSKSREMLLKKLTTCELALKQYQKDFFDKFTENAYLYILAEPIQKLKDKIQAEEKIRENQLINLNSYKPFKEFLNSLFKMDIVPVLSTTQKEQLLSNGDLYWKQQTSSASDEMNHAILMHDLNKQQQNFLLSIPVKSKNEMITLSSHISRLESDLTQLEAEVRNAPEFLDVEEENIGIDNLTKMLGEVELRMRNIRNKNNTLREEKSKIENLISRSNTNTNNSEQLENQLNQVNSLISFIKEYITEITDLKAHYIKNEFSKMLTSLIRKQDEFGLIEFDINTYTIRLYNDRNQEISITDRSAGEMQIISSALIWALTKSSSYTLPMLIDTPLGRLDSYHRNHLINKYYKELSEQVIILSTDTEITQEYIDVVTQHSYKQYVLDYNNELKYTTILDGYFNLKGETNV